MSKSRRHCWSGLNASMAWASFRNLRTNTTPSGKAWTQGQGSYLEVSSVSNCEDFQARRMNLRFKAETGENRFPHILNGSGTALARLFVALVETYQQADGSLTIPPVLQAYLKTDRIS